MIHVINEIQGAQSIGDCDIAHLGSVIPLNGKSRIFLYKFDQDSLFSDVAIGDLPWDKIAETLFERFAFSIKDFC